MAKAAIIRSKHFKRVQKVEGKVDSRKSLYKINKKITEIDRERERERGARRFLRL
jgi:hypothetical protein